MSFSFSSRIPESLAQNRLARAREHMSASRTAVVDLTVSNPTLAGFEYPTDIVHALDAATVLEYRPEPLGLRTARRAVAAYLRRHDLDVDAARVVLTASTSDAYAMLFKLLCDPGDEVMVPRPSYPLLEHLARLDSVVATPYSLDYHGRWEIDVAGLARLVTSRTRAVVMVNPNNPTGSFASNADIDGVVTLCHDHGLALVADEVFGVYPMVSARRGPSVLDVEADVLTFVLGGLSKAVGLPGYKLGWIVIAGPQPSVDAALERLELICDTYLSVGTPVQVAVEDLLALGAAVTAQIAARVRRNYECLGAVVAAHPAAELLPVEGGWYAVVHVPAIDSEETLVLDLLEREQILVHPGYFYDFPREAFLVMSLLPRPSVFEPATRRVLARAAGGVSARP